MRDEYPSPLYVSLVMKRPALALPGQLVGPVGAEIRNLVT